MSLRLALCALLTLIFCACSTPPAEPVVPTLSDEIRTACEPLPELKVKPGEEMRQALLQNRAESQLVHGACTARHKGVLEAVGSSPLKGAPAPDRWADYINQLKALK